MHKLLDDLQQEIPDFADSIGGDARTATRALETAFKAFLQGGPSCAPRPFVGQPANLPDGPREQCAVECAGTWPALARALNAYGAAASKYGVTVPRSEDQ